MNDIERIPNAPGQPRFPFLSAGTRWGDLLFTSGHVGLVQSAEPSMEGERWTPGDLAPGGIVGQTEQALANMLAVVSKTGGCAADVLKVNAYLRDIDRDFAGFNEVYMKIFPGQPPARTTVQAKLYGLILVEVECVAAVRGQGS